MKNITPKQWQTIKDVLLFAMYIVIMMHWVIMPLFNFLLPISPITNDFINNDSVLGYLIEIIKMGVIMLVLVIPALVFYAFNSQAE